MRTPQKIWIAVLLCLIAGIEGSRESRETITRVESVFENLSGESADRFKEKIAAGERVTLIGVITQPVTSGIASEVNRLFNPQHTSQPYDSEMPLDKLSPREQLFLTFFPMSYPKWIHRKNVILVPLDCNQPLEKLVEVAQRLNGLLLPGGKTTLWTENFGAGLEKEHEAKDFLGGAPVESTLHGKPPSPGERRPVDDRSPSSFAKASFSLIQALIDRMNDNSELRTPIFGTCLGFQQLILFNHWSPSHLKEVFNLDNPSHLNLLGDEKHNFLKKRLSEEDQKAAQEGSSYFFNHKFAVPLSVFEKTPALTEAFEVIGTSVPNPSAPSGKENHWQKEEFVAAIAHKKYPIFGVQFHPEKNQFEKHLKLGASPEDLRLVNAFADQFHDSIKGQASVEDVDFVAKFLEGSKPLILDGYKTFDAIFLTSKPPRREIIII